MKVGCFEINLPFGKLHVQAADLFHLEHLADESRLRVHNGQKYLSQQFQEPQDTLIR